MENRLRLEKYLFSWDSYVRGILIGSYYIQRAAIFDLCGSLLANWPHHFIVENEEFINLVAAVHVPNLRRGGVVFERERYRVECADGKNAIMAIKGEPGIGQQGFTIARTRSKVIFGWHDESVPPSKCNLTVMTLADFFNEKDI